MPYKTVQVRQGGSVEMDCNEMERQGYRLVAVVPGFPTTTISGALDPIGRTPELVFYKP